ncbi:MAG: 4Fe-4S dicluster domain-containing protein [Nitrospirae bacterium]|nr:MAG: 4Fe-4S dicluster domain-containing protein [Nitrospirota bacterium]
MDRRGFLKLAGFVGLAAGAACARRVAGPGSRYTTADGAATAKRWAMVIDTRRFHTPEDYQRVIDACHRAHNVPHIDNVRHEVKWIWTDTFEHAFPDQVHPHLPREIAERPFLLLCNQCDNPPCTQVCPTDATYRLADGIVAQDYHRCIGCRFCMAGCPYGARSFNWVDPRPHLDQVNPEFPTRNIGVVEKCNFCVDRLERGEPVRCAEASGGAIVVGDLNDPDSEVSRLLATHYTLTRKPELGARPNVFYIVEQQYAEADEEVSHAG